MSSDYEDDIEDGDNAEAMADIDEADVVDQDEVEFEAVAPQCSLAVRRALEIRREQQRMERELDYLNFECDE